jgi:hypothetical protein
MLATVVPRAESGFDGCRGWLKPLKIAGEDASVGDVLATVMGHGLEHHFVLIDGEEMAVLGEFGSWTVISTLRCIPQRDYLHADDYDMKLPGSHPGT